MLLQALASVAHFPILHLSDMNPHVASTIPRQGAFYIPRQPAPGPAAGNGDSFHTWGVSAFAFQGTNAHALLLADATAGALPKALSNPHYRAWAKARFWIGPEPHHLLGRVARAMATALLYETELLLPKASYLWDHAVSGRAILPGTAFLEAGAACLGTALADEAAALQALLARVTIPVPLELPAAASRLLVQCQVETASGRVKVGSLGPAGSREHMYGTAATAAVAVLQASTAAKTTLAPSAAVLAACFRDVSPLAGSTVGVIEGTRRDGRVGGKGASPACLDAAFHLGALPQPGAKPVLRIPASIQGYQVLARSPEGQLVGGCQPMRTAQHSVVNDYWLRSMEGTLCYVEGLEARALSQLAARKSAAAAPAPSAAAAAQPAVEAEAGLLYQVSWAASEAAPLPPSGTARQQLKFAHGQPAVMVCASGIAALQQGSTSGSIVLTAPGLHASSHAAPAAAPSGLLASSLLYGLLKAAIQENPSSGFTSVGLDSQQAASTALQLGSGDVPAGADAHGTLQRGGALYQPALIRCTVPPAHDARLAEPTASRCAITGGTGTLGQLVASYLAANQDARRLTLLGRTGRLASAEAAAKLLGAESLAAIVLAMCDTAASEDAAGALSAAEPQALVHSGGMLADAVLGNLTPAHIRRAFAPKVSSMLAMGRRLGAEPTALQLLFSSVASLLGSPGQANYSAANAVLDALAGALQQQVCFRVVNGHAIRDRKLQLAILLCDIQISSSMQTQRQHLLFCALYPRQGVMPRSSENPTAMCAAWVQGQLGVSVQWGAWAGAGMASQDRSTALRVERMGMGMVTPALGLAAMASLLASSHAAPVVAAVPFRWDRLAQQAQRSPAAVASIFRARLTAGPVAGGAAAIASSTAGSAPPAVSKEALLSSVLEVLAAVLGTSVGPQEPLMAAGLDSLASVEFRNSLEAKLQMKLPTTLIFDYPTAAAIAEYAAAAAAAAARLPSAAAASQAQGAAAGGADREAHLRQVSAEVAAVAAEVLGMPGLDLEQPLMAAGLDSLGAVELRNALQSRLGVELPTTVVFDYPSISAMAAYVTSKQQPAAPSTQGGIIELADLFSTAAVAPSQKGLGFSGAAVCGMATRSPKVGGLCLCACLHLLMLALPAAQGNSQAPFGTGPPDIRNVTTGLSP